MGICDRTAKNVRRAQIVSDEGEGTLTLLRKLSTAREEPLSCYVSVRQTTKGVLAYWPSRRSHALLIPRITSVTPPGIMIGSLLMRGMQTLFLVVYVNIL